MESLRAGFQLIPPSIPFTSTHVPIVLIQKNSMIFILEIDLVLREPTSIKRTYKIRELHKNSLSALVLPQAIRSSDTTTTDMCSDTHTVFVAQVTHKCVSSTCHQNLTEKTK